MKFGNEKNKNIMPLVSVIMPTFNRKKTILRAINSVLNQTYTNYEIIIIDDGSNDGTVEVINALKNDKIRLYVQSHNQGANVARNIGIKNAKGEYIAFLDSDDEWFENKLEKQIKYLIDDKSLLVCFCSYQLFETNNTTIIPNITDKNADIGIILKKYNLIGTPTLIMHKSVFEKVGLFNETLGRLQDYEFAIRIVQEYKIGFIPEVLVNAYRVSKSISNDWDSLLSAEIYIIENYTHFIDIEERIHIFLQDAGIFKGNYFNWEYIDKYVKNNTTKDLIYRTVIQYLYKKNRFYYEYEKKKFLDFCNQMQNKKICIFGTGFYGKKAMKEVCRKNMIVQSYLVSKKGDEKEIEGVPIIEISMLKNKQIPIIVAVSGEKQEEVIEIILQNKFVNYCIYPIEDER